MPDMLGKDTFIVSFFEEAKTGRSSCVSALIQMQFLCLRDHCTDHSLPIHLSISLAS